MKTILRDTHSLDAAGVDNISEQIADVLADYPYITKRDILRLRLGAEEILLHWRQEVGELRVELSIEEKGRWVDLMLQMDGVPYRLTPPDAAEVSGVSGVESTLANLGIDWTYQFDHGQNSAYISVEARESHRVRHVLTAMALALSYLENFFPLSLAIPIPGVKLGLANIVTVFALYVLGPGQAMLILLARCLLGAVFAGNMNALIFSLLGGVSAMLVMIGLSRWRRLSVYGVSIGGAAAHNCGQVAAAVLTLGNTAPFYYLPVLLGVSLFTGALTGLVTACLFRALAHTNLMRE